MSAVKCPTCGRTWICMTGTPASISPMILCKKCKGEYPAQQECEACGGNGLDPESFCGCCEEPEPEEGAPLIPPKYSVITLRRTSRFTVYALFDEVAKHVLPETSTRDKADTTAHAKRLNRA